ncbi:MAG: hypothetical protein R3B72_06145 [Polyangiaceae bacterium]
MALLAPAVAQAEEPRDAPSVIARGAQPPKGPAPSTDQPALGPVAAPTGDVPMVTIDNSPRLIKAGIICVSVGGTVAGLGVAGMVASFDGKSSDMAPMGAAMSLLATVVGGLTVVTGVPLWIAGEYDITVPATHKKAIEQLGPFVPDRVSLGPGELTAAWSF